MGLLASGVHYAAIFQSVFAGLSMLVTLAGLYFAWRGLVSTREKILAEYHKERAAREREREARRTRLERHLGLVGAPSERRREVERMLGLPNGSLGQYGGGSKILRLPERAPDAPPETFAAYLAAKALEEA